MYKMPLAIGLSVVVLLAYHPVKALEATENECAVSLHPLTRGGGPSFEIRGSRDVLDISELEYRNGVGLEDNIRSVSTSSSAWLELFDDADFDGAVFRVGPGRSEDLEDHYDSLRVYCRQPANWEEH